MKVLIYILFLVSCTTKSPLLNNEHNLNDIDKLLLLHSSNKIEKLRELFGKPDKVFNKQDGEVIYGYKTGNYKNINLEVLVNSSSGEVIGSSLFYWKSFDNYEYLKNKLSDFKWIETPIKSKSVDVIEEKFKVNIPEAGITFEYDNQDPLRRVMWIFFTTSLK